MQRRAKAGINNRIENPAFDDDRARYFIDSLYAIAQADGFASSEELVEIESIAAEFGLKPNENRSPAEALDTRQRQDT